MADFQGLGAKFEGFQSSTSGSSSSPFVAAKRAFPNSAYSRYTEVQVLLIRWEEDELEVEWELNELQRVLHHLYGFTTDKFLIPTQNSHRKLNHKVLGFVEEHENEDTLLIVYYGGHGIINKARQSTWSCKGDTSYATVEWSAIQTLFEMVKCDVLLLLDCCAGASAAPLTERPTNIKETIAACGFETWTPRPGAQSFTHTLIEVLKEWASQLPFSAAMLHSEILTRLKHAQPDRSSQGRLIESRKTPAYILSTSDPHAASITLGRMFEEESSSVSSSRAIPESDLRSLSERVQSDTYISSEDRIQALLAVGAKGQRAAPHVLLTIALEEEQVYDAASCARWLKQFPLLATHVSVESVYRSYSTLLLLSVPVVLWDLLPEHPATQFVGYVKSRNLLSIDMAKDGAATPIPIARQVTGDKTGGDSFDCVSPLRSVSGLSSLDSGYDSCLSRPASLGVALRHNRLPMDGTMGSLASQALASKRRNKLSSTELLGPERPTSTPVNARFKPKQGSSLKSRRSKRLVVSVGEAELDNDKIGYTCVLWYGYDVQQSQSTKRTTPKPIWNEDFRFEAHDSPMYYHLRVSVWGAQMLELIGELHVDLCELVLRGQLPELGAWQSLSLNSAAVGRIRIKLAYMDANEYEEQQATATKVSAAKRQ
ncbi:uncharacterized protein FTJAE_10712 [Fusarium tjaetaba]|uniref:C2 domain-containing protein n=1 Tax=Fusarium tjaetaba TaxID=1567544 RepID=A0A8H5QYB6_9HYPO|nr:uncharacterized protein FTJAE_10712 [Fusarium tjaetaba]KAF5623159.1 hypothetical protein FTJAE_10712 [Fusarium tjaetaba]